MRTGVRVVVPVVVLDLTTQDPSDRGAFYSDLMNPLSILVDRFRHCPARFREPFAHDTP
jgi:hypothetical protein